jgi:hypothetical protein
MSARVMCMSPGCSVFFDIDILDPRFPDGPFHCPRCVERLKVAKRPDDSLAPVVIDELGEGVASVIVTVPKKW